MANDDKNKTEPVLDMEKTMHPAASEPLEPAVEAPLQAPHPVHVLGTTVMVDPEIDERQERIAAKRAEIDRRRVTERARLVEAERALTIRGLDEAEAELDAQLARVRGERNEE